MARISIYISEKLKVKMDLYGFDWGELARHAFETAMKPKPKAHANARQTPNPTVPRHRSAQAAPTQRRRGQAPRSERSEFRPIE
jgi:hypothetical protein